MTIIKIINRDTIDTIRKKARDIRSGFHKLDFSGFDRYKKQEDASLYSEMDETPITADANNLDIERLRKEHQFMFALLVDIERAIEHEDKQQISVSIKRLRHNLPTKHFMTGNLKPGLERDQ